MTVLSIGNVLNAGFDTFQVKRKAEHQDGRSTKQKVPLKQSIWSLSVIHDYEIIRKCMKYEHTEKDCYFFGETGTVSLFDK